MSRMPSTSTGTVSDKPAASAVRSTSVRSGLGSGGSTSGSCGERRERDRLARKVDVAADEADELLLEEVVDDQPPVVHRLGDHGLRELAVDAAR